MVRQNINGQQNMQSERNEKDILGSQKKLIALKPFPSFISLRSRVCHCHGCEIGQSDADDEVGKM